MSYIYRVRLVNQNLHHQPSTSLELPYSDKFKKKFKTQHRINAGLIGLGGVGNYVGAITTQGTSNVDLMQLGQQISYELDSVYSEKGTGKVFNQDGTLPKEINIKPVNILRCQQYHNESGKTEIIYDAGSVETILGTDEFYIVSEQSPEDVALDGLTTGVMFENSEDAESFLTLTRDIDGMENKIDAFSQNKELKSVTDKCSHLIDVYLSTSYTNDVRIDKKDKPFLKFYAELLQHDNEHIRLLAILGILSEKRHMQDVREMLVKSLPEGWNTEEKIMQEVSKFLGQDKFGIKMAEGTVNMVLEGINNSLDKDSNKDDPKSRISQLYYLINQKPKTAEDYRIEKLNKKDYSSAITRTLENSREIIDKYEREKNKPMSNHEPTKNMFDFYNKLMESDNEVIKLVALYGILGYEDPYEIEKKKFSSGDYWHNSLTTRIRKQYEISVDSSRIPVMVQIHKSLGTELAEEIFSKITEFNKNIASGKTKPNEIPDFLDMISSEINRGSKFSPPEKSCQDYIKKIMEKPRGIIDENRQDPGKGVVQGLIKISTMNNYINTIGSVRASCYYLMLHEKDPFVNLIGILGILQDYKNPHASVHLKNSLLEVLPPELNTEVKIKKYLLNFVPENEKNNGELFLDNISNKLDLLNKKISAKWSKVEPFSATHRIEETKELIKEIKTSNPFDYDSLKSPSHSVSVKEDFKQRLSNKVNPVEKEPLQDNKLIF